jgi:enoyl-[acyl-carrier-protein] reductase (NADH)
VALDLNVAGISEVLSLAGGIAAWLEEFGTDLVVTFKLVPAGGD